MIETSVVIPTYRRPPELEQAIASIFAQQAVAMPFEILVVDNDPDGSAATVAMAMAARSQRGGTVLSTISGDL
jgi:glycosyltransferase involved in cell wall biosynthesis